MPNSPMTLVINLNSFNKFGLISSNSSFLVSAFSFSLFFGSLFDFFDAAGNIVSSYKINSSFDFDFI
jgi:hypothetical protein